MTFQQRWRATPGNHERRPCLSAHLRRLDGALIRQVFIIDSGADVSIAPRRLCSLLGYSWQRGWRMDLLGISPKPECKVVGRVHQVRLLVEGAGIEIRLPMCFADGQAPLLLGREGFFDAFRIRFDKKGWKTIFEVA